MRRKVPSEISLMLEGKTLPSDRNHYHGSNDRNNTNSDDEDLFTLHTNRTHDEKFNSSRMKHDDYTSLQKENIKFDYNKKKERV